MENKLLNVSIIAGNIRRLRKVANLSQIELAKQLCVSSSRIYAWEKGRSYPNLVNVLSICNYFRIRVDDLIGVPTMKQK